MTGEIFIDTNFFLRFFLKDIKNQYLEAKEVFQQGARGKKNLRISIIVIFEVFWVLSSSYQYDRNQLIRIIESILKMSFIRLDEKFILQDALILYKITNLSLGDCYNLAFSKHMEIKKFKTFDKKLDKVAKELLEKETLDNVRI